MQSIGFDPSLFGRRSKLLQLLRLVPFVERNYNLIELVPRGRENLISIPSSHPMVS